MPDQPAPGLIEIRLNSVGQLFNSFDPSPFQGRDLDDDAEEFIVGSAREFGGQEKLRIVVHLPPDQCETEAARTLASAVAQHFDYRTGVMKRELSELFRQGRLYLFVGLSIFVVCTVLAQLVRNAPLELLIYDWWPLRRRIGLFQRLAGADIEVRSAA
jgi:hypothetical protein